MSSLFDKYSAIYGRLKEIHTQYVNAESQLSMAKEQDSVARLQRIENLEKQLEKIEEYNEKVDYFRQLAEKHLLSKNLLTITPRELNFNRLRNWAMKINPMEPDDPYAQRIYVQAKCNEMFLRIKKDEFEKTLKELKGHDDSENQEKSKAVEQLKKSLLIQCTEILESEEFSQFVNELRLEHVKYTDIQKLQTICSEFLTDSKSIGIGGHAQPLPILDEVKNIAKLKIGEFYDTVSSNVLLPVEISAEKENILAIACNAGKEKKVYRGIQNYLLNYLSISPIGANKIYLLDALHYNNSSLGALRQLEGTVALESVPKGAEAIVDTLKQIVSSLADIDEIIGMYDSVDEYNKAVSPEERIERKMLVLIGYPSAFSGEAKEYIKRILYNFEHYGISMILVDTQFSEKSENGKKGDLPVELVQGVVKVQMLPQRETVSKNNGSYHQFRWYELKQELNESFLTEIKNMSTKAGMLGTEYIKRIDMNNFPEYERGKKSIVLPYGVDQKDEVHSISFDNENFASYLMGASGSGKSTLLHTLITGIIRDYHPDDVELWLADFKMSEFAQYINPLPPHIKYILLDESQELIYDLIDKLTEKMMERQRFFMSPEYRELKKVENVPKQNYMPVIFVILDEFSIMSQAVSESEYYKLRLQNLLAKGRALGIKFIFASQTFTKGIGGLTSTAKDQIQSRIAMKNSYNEINETLELSADLRTDQVRGWMNALPPHYTLIKYRDGDVMRVKRLQVMYFKGNGDEALKPQRNLVEYRRKMTPVEVYNPEDNLCYVDKHPVIVDGNSFKAIDMEYLKEKIRDCKNSLDTSEQEDEMFLVFGSPRRMSEVELAPISKESRENLLVVARNAEQACEMSVILSSMKQFEMQGGKVHIWAYHKNRLYRAYKDSHFSNYQIAEGIEEICIAISEMKENIIQKRQGNDLIVMLGMEQICSDFELIDFNGSGGSAHLSGPSVLEMDTSKLEAKTEEDKKAVEEVKQAEKDLEAILDEIIERGTMLGKDQDEIDREMEEATLKYFSELDESDYDDEATNEEVTDNSTEDNEEEEVAVEVKSKEYNALGDFKYIVRQGSRLGYHFMLCLNNISDLSSTGLQIELFRHKLAFQTSGDDSVQIFSTRIASKIPEHICQYSSGLEQYSFRPFLHEGVTWDGWQIDENGKVVDAGMIL